MELLSILISHKKVNANKAKFEDQIVESVKEEKNILKEVSQILNKTMDNVEKEPFTLSSNIKYIEKP